MLITLGPEPNIISYGLFDVIKDPIVLRIKNMNYWIIHRYIPRGQYDQIYVPITNYATKEFCKLKYKLWKNSTRIIFVRNLQRRKKFMSEIFL